MRLKGISISRFLWANSDPFQMLQTVTNSASIRLWYWFFTGLGTSTSKEAREYFMNMRRHRIQFKYNGEEDDQALDMAFSKKKIEERKIWLTNWMAVCSVA